MPTKPNLRHPAIIRFWLATVALATLGMVLVGGVTRLTDSGLSMTDWKPILGTMPPRTPAQWDDRFDQYKASPQFQKVFPDMEMSAFKRIFFWEWLHRVLGRVVGLLALLPWLAFAALGWIRGRWLGLLFLVPLLVLLQGLLGWFMVRSGLVDIPRVSPFRLGAHLGLALLLLCYCLWQFGRVVDVRKPSPNRLLTWGAWLVAGLVGGQSFLGAIVAGMDAGLVGGTTWPTMAGRLIPPFETGSAMVVHFIHRHLAWVVAFALISFAWKGLRSSSLMRQRVWSIVLVVLVAIQIALGIFTVIRGMQIHFASAHQLNAALLLGASVMAAGEWSR